MSSLQTLALLQLHENTHLALLQVLPPEHPPTIQLAALLTGLQCQPSLRSQLMQVRLLGSQRTAQLWFGAKALPEGSHTISEFVAHILLPGLHVLCRRNGRGRDWPGRVHPQKGERRSPELLEKEKGPRLFWGRRLGSGRGFRLDDYLQVPASVQTAPQGQPVAPGAQVE